MVSVGTPEMAHSHYHAPLSPLKTSAGRTLEAEGLTLGFGPCLCGFFPDVFDIALRAALVRCEE
jgi:hypothetical protein